VRTDASPHSVSNHLRFSARRDPLPQRWPHYFVRASPCARRLARTADRIEFTLSAHPNGPCYGLVVHFQLLSTRGCRPDAVTFSYWPYSVGQVRDFHPAVPVRSQAHGRGLQSAGVLFSERSFGIMWVVSAALTLLRDKSRAPFGAAQGLHPGASAWRSL